MDTPVSIASLDSAAFAQYVEGKETPLKVSDGPRHVLWTQESVSEWDGVRFGESKRSGTRHLRIGWKGPLAVGSVLVRCGGQLSVFKPNAAYPGDLNDESQWRAAERIKDGRVSCDEVQSEEYAIWVLPPGTTTRALRFTHTAQVLAAKDGNYELSVPLAALGLRPEAHQMIRGDIGVLRGNGFQTLQRVYWNDKATGLTSDVPSEAQLTPQLWGVWQFRSDSGRK